MIGGFRVLIWLCFGWLGCLGDCGFWEASCGFRLAIASCCLLTFVVLVWGVVFLVWLLVLAGDWRLVRFG